MTCLCKKDFYKFVLKFISEENNKLGLVPTPKLEEARKMILKDLCKKVEKKYKCKTCLNQKLPNPTT